MKIFVTGGCGFLGSNLAADALSQGDAVLVMDNLSRVGGRENLAWLKNQGEFEFEEGDTRDAARVEAAVARFHPDAVFHLAGQVAMTTSLADPRADFEINAGGALNVLEAVRRRAPEAAVLFSSTNKVYGDLEQFTYRETETRYVCDERPNGFGEDTPLEFRSPYGCSKGAADQYMLDYARMFGLKTVVFRHSSMYGGRQFATTDQGWIGWFCRKSLEVRAGTLKEPFTISGNGKQVRDVLFEDDMRRLYRAALKNIGVARGHAFNIGGGMENSLSLLELFAWLESRLNIRLRPSILPSRASDQKIFVAEGEKARRLLDWSPRVGKDEGLEKMLDWTSAGA